MAFAYRHSGYHLPTQSGRSDPLIFSAAPDFHIPVCLHLRQTSCLNTSQEPGQLVNQRTLPLKQIDEGSRVVTSKAMEYLIRERYTI